MTFSLLQDVPFFSFETHYPNKAGILRRLEVYTDQITMQRLPDLMMPQLM